MGSTLPCGLISMDTKERAQSIKAVATAQDRRHPRAKRTHVVVGMAGRNHSNILPYA